MARIWFARTSPRYWRSPHGAQVQRFADWLDAVGYSRDSIEGHVCRLFEALSHAHVRGACRWQVSELARLFDPYCTTANRSWRYRATERVYCRYLACHVRLDERSPGDPLEPLCHGYQEYLCEVRGFVASTTAQHLCTVRDFLHEATHAGTLKALGPGDIERYLERRGRGLTRQSLQHVIAQLRGFLRYAFRMGLVARRLDEIDTPRTYRDELPPRALPWREVRALLRSVDRSSKAGWRDAAVLHLMAYYGLRASEIASLRLDAIDWQARTARITQRKTHSDLTLPLTHATLVLLRKYLHHGRATSALPYLFLRVRCPIGPLQTYGVCDLFYKRVEESGLDLAGCSSYALRHSFAMRLLQRGVGIKAIGDLLGHRSLEATSVYLRLDTMALKGVGLPLP